MSGIYGLPILLQNNYIDLRGFVAIAPAATPKFSKQQYQSVDVPVLVMYGERDKTDYMKESVYWMENIPDHTSVMIKKAEHAAFVGNPEDFHKEILRFLSTQCTLGEDTDTDNGLSDVYDDDDLFGYEGGDDMDTDSDYYDDTENNEKDQKYFAEYFAGADDKYGQDYYDETDLFFDNKDQIGPEYDTDTQIDINYGEEQDTDNEEDPDLGDDNY